MKISRLSIQNFRGITNATLHFEGHTLLIGANNVGKSTVCEAIDLVLGTDRLSKFPPIEEFDFYNSVYLEDDKATAKEIRIGLVIIDLSSDVSSNCSSHIEFWNIGEKRLLTEGEIDHTDEENVVACLRLETIAKYNVEEDEFEAQTYFSHSPDQPENTLKPVSKNIKRSIGFLYLRTLRTGSRALSLERGSLLDLILRLSNVKAGLWEKSIVRLRELQPPIDEDAEELRGILNAIEKRLAEYIPTQGDNAVTKLFVSQLTREHLRKTMSFFLSITSDQQPVPFQEVGTGTLNILVLTLLSFIAELKKDNVIFAMEEPEIALPPHSQRRVINYLLSETTQCFVTSHSPYVVEAFEPEQIRILRRSTFGELSSTPVQLDGTIKLKNYRKQSRRGLSEAMLGNAVIIVEGLTDQTVLWAVSDMMETADKSNYPLDLSGVTVFCNDGDGSMPAFGAFFKKQDISTYALYDKKKRSEDEKKKISESFDFCYEIPYTGIEALIAEEVPIKNQWDFLLSIKAMDEDGDYGIPAIKPDDNAIKNLTIKTLKGMKGDGSAARLIQSCKTSELPATIVTFLNQIYTDFPGQRIEIVDLDEIEVNPDVNHARAEAAEAVAASAITEQSNGKV